MSNTSFSVFAFLFTTLLCHLVSTLDTCSNTGSTLYDGYLDTQISFANFSQAQNSYLKFTNPYLNSIPLTTSTITFWAKVPAVSTSGTPNTGRFLDCQDIVSVRLINDTVKYDVNIGTNQATGTLLSQAFANTLTSLTSWNSYTFTFASGTLSFYLNGVIQLSQSSSQSFLTTTSPFCMMGNSLNMSDAFNGYLRHFYFGKQAWNSNSNITNLIHHVNLPQDSNRLTYFQFSNNFLNNDHYTFNSSLQYIYNNVLTSSESSPEFVCYCTSTYPNYLNISSSFTLAPLNLQALSATQIDANGLMLDFWIYAQKSSMNMSDDLLFSFSNYVNVVLTNNSNTLRLDIFNSSNNSTPSQSIYFSNTKFRYNYWTWYTIQLTRSYAVIFQDGSLTDRIAFTLQTYPSTTSQFSIRSPSTINYLLNMITIRTARNVVVLNYTYSEQNLTLPLQQSIVSNGSAIFGQSNNLCYSTQANLTNYWTGFGCVDRRLYPYFNGKTNSSSSNLLSQMQSSLSTMTIQIWIRDINNISSTQQVFFENSLNGTSPLIQMSITTGGLTSATRSITCNPQASAGTVQAVTIPSVTTYNIWGHFACISDASVNQISSIFHSSWTNSDYSVSVSGATFSNQASSIITALGSSVTGGNKFIGFIRELRVWSTARTPYQISLYRYQFISSQSGLLYYYALSDQVNPLVLFNSLSPTSSFLESSLTSPSITYTQDKDLIICQPGLYYNGQCCQPFSLSGVDFKFQYSVSKNQFQVYVDQTSLSDQYLYVSVKANFSVTAVGNNYYTVNNGQNQSYLSYAQTLFNQNQTQGFNVSSILLSPSIYSLTLSAQIYSDYQPSTSVTVTHTLQLTCPSIWLTILPNYATDLTQTVSLISNLSEPVIYLNSVNLCYNPSNNTYTSYSISQVSWSMNITSLKFANVFTTASDSMSIAAVSNKSGLNGTNQYVKVSAAVTYSNKASLSNSIQMYFAPVDIITNQQSSSISSNLIQGDYLTLDLSSATATPSTSTILYSVSCPSSIFSSTTQYNSLCSISSTGTFNMSTSSLPLIANYPYYFVFYMNINNTSVLSEVVDVVQFYKNGGSSQCPRVSLNQAYQYQLYQNANLQIIPDPYLYCSGTYYQISSVNWTVVDSISGANMSSVLSFGSQTVFRSANVTPSTMVTAGVMSGQILNVTVTFNTANANSPSSLSTQTASTQILFSQTPLVPTVYVYSKNKTILTNNTVPYVEELMILNASQSYDPDSSSANLSYTWTCPSIITQYYTCESLYRGGQNVYLYLNALQRAKIGVQFNTPYNFTITAKSNNNPYKTPVTTTVTVYFAAPLTSDTQYNYNMPPICDTVTASGSNLVKVSSTYQKVLKFDITNVTNATTFNTSFTASLTCSGGSVTEQIMLLYIQNVSYFGNNPASILFEQNSTSTSLLSTNTIFVNLSNYPMSQVGFTQYQQVTIYWFTQRQNNPDQIYLSTDSVFLYRNKANLVAQFVNPAVTVDKYSTLNLDASASYDPDNLGLNYTYRWTCPNTVSCASTTTSTLALTANSREAGNADVNGTTYQYLVQMSDGSRVSQIATATVTISMLSSYAFCLKVALVSEQIVGYNAPLNTIFLEYNQSIPTPIEMQLSTACDSVNIEQSSFTPMNTSATFWKADSSSTTKVWLTNQALNANLSPGSNQTVMFKQQYSMGLDTSIKMYSYTYINIYMSIPDLVINITGPKIYYFINSTDTLTLDGSNSYDPLGSLQQGINSYIWECPSYFGMSSPCSQQVKLTIGQSNVPSQYLDMPHQINLTIVSSDNLRTQFASYWLYIASSSSQLAQNSASSCSITSQNSSTYLTFESTQPFTFTCTNSKASSYFSNTQMSWSIDGLSANIDYYTVNNSLYLKPYRASMAKNGVFTVDLLIANVNVNPIKWTYNSTLMQLISGSVSVSPSQSFIPFSQQYNLTFNSFTSTKQYGILMQLRVYSVLYNSYQVMHAMKPFTAEYLSFFYQNVSFSNVSAVYFDFFDMSLNYMGSYNLLSNTNMQTTYQQFTQSNFETLLFPIVSKTSLNYSNTTYSKMQFESDFTQILQVSEVLLKNYISVSGNNISSLVNQYANLTLVYVTSTYVNVINLYATTILNVYDQMSKKVLDKNLVYILYNTLKTNPSIQNYTLASDILDLFDYLISNYNSLMAFGEDQGIIREYMISSIGLMYNQVQNMNTTQNITVLEQRLKNQSYALLGSSLSTLQPGQSTSTVYGSINTQVVMLTSSINSTSQSTQLQNIFNSNESVTIANQASLYNDYGVSTVEVAFTLQTDVEAPTGTVVYINAFDQNYQPVDVDFSSAGQTSLTVRILNKIYNTVRYFLRDSPNTSESPSLTSSTSSISFSLQITTDFQLKFNESWLNNQSDIYYKPICVYYNNTQSLWLTDGVTTINYDNTTGLCECSTTHLSQFSLSYLTLSKSNGSGNPNVTVYEYYFDQYPGVYAGSVAGASFIVLATIAISLKSYTLWDQNPFNNQVDNVMDEGFCKIFGSTLLLYSSLISAMVGPYRANIHTTMSKFNKMMNLWSILFFISLGVAVVFYFRDKITVITDWSNYLNLIILGALCVGAVLLLRIVFISLSFIIYFKGSQKAEDPKNVSQTFGKKSRSSSSDKKKKKKKKTRSIRSDDDEALLSQTGSKKSKSSKKSSKSKKSKSKELRQKYNFDLEGGSSEDEFDFQRPKKKQGESGKREKSKNRNEQDLKEKNVKNQYDATKYYQEQAYLNIQFFNRKSSSSRPNKYSSVEEELPKKTHSNRKNIKSTEFKASSPGKKVYGSEFSKEKAKYVQDSEGMLSDKDGSKKSKGKQIKYEKVEDARTFKDKTKQVVNNENDFSGMIKKNNDKYSSDYKKDNQYSSMNYQSQPKAPTHPSIYKPQNDTDFVPKRLDSKYSMLSEDKEYKTRINSSIDSYSEFTKQESKKKKKRSKKEKMEIRERQMIEDTTTPQYNAAKMVVSLFKMFYLLSLMGLTYWMMRYLPNQDFLYYWLEVTFGSFLAIILVIDPLFCFLFALFYKCTGPGTCVRVMGAILLGNGHANVINALIYELNN